MTDTDLTTGYPEGMVYTFETVHETAPLPKGWTRHLCKHAGPIGSSEFVTIGVNFGEDPEAEHD